LVTLTGPRTHRRSAVQTLEIVSRVLIILSQSVHVRDIQGLYFRHGGQSVKQYHRIALIVFLVLMAGSSASVNAQQNYPQGFDWGFRFIPGTLVISRSVYQGKASTVTIGESLPLGCQGGLTGLTVNVPLIAGGTTPVAVPCGVATDNG
jgi:hypothetical protein